MVDISVHRTKLYNQQSLRNTSKLYETIPLASDKVMTFASWHLWTKFLAFPSSSIDLSAWELACPGHVQGIWGVITQSVQPCLGFAAEVNGLSAQTTCHDMSAVSRRHVYAFTPGQCVTWCMAIFYSFLQDVAFIYIDIQYTFIFGSITQRTADDWKSTHPCCIPGANRTCHHMLCSKYHRCHRRAGLRTRLRWAQSAALTLYHQAPTWASLRQHSQKKETTYSTWSYMEKGGQKQVLAVELHQEGMTSRKKHILYVYSSWCGMVEKIKIDY